MTKHIEEERKKFELWFFRDLNDEQRLSLMSLFGMPVDEIGGSTGRQKVAIRHILRRGDFGFDSSAFAAAEERGRMEEREANGWLKVPEEPPLELLKSININNQVLAYENGRYYNAWFTFDASEGGWFWNDDADSEPNPSHYRKLDDPPAITKEPTPTQPSSHVAVSDDVLLAACRAHTPQFDRLDVDIARYAKDQMRKAITAAIKIMEISR